MELRDYGVIVLRGYGVKTLHILGLIWLWGYRSTEFSDFLKCFLRLGQNSKYAIVAFFAQTFFLWARVIKHMY